MGHPTGHLAKGAQPFLLNDCVLGAPQFVIGLLRAFGQAHLVEEGAALFLGREDFGLQRVLFLAHGLDLEPDGVGFEPNLLQHQHNHADGNE
jgi:hypothetical protein